MTGVKQLLGFVWFVVCFVAFVFLWAYLEHPERTWVQVEDRVEFLTLVACGSVLGIASFLLCSVTAFKWLFPSKK